MVTLYHNLEYFEPRNKETTPAAGVVSCWLFLRFLMLRMLFTPLTEFIELQLFLGFLLVLPRIVIDAVADRAFHLDEVFAELGSHSLGKFLISNI